MGEIANNAAQPEPNGIDYDCIDKQLLAVVVEIGRLSVSNEISMLLYLSSSVANEYLGALLEEVWALGCVAEDEDAHDGISSHLIEVT